MSKAAVKSKDPRGLKRVCVSCGIRFYDLNKRPIICPSCDTEFTGETKVKTRRGKAAAKETASQVKEKAAKDVVANDDDSKEDENEIQPEKDTVSLDDVEVVETSDDDDEEDLDLPDPDLENLDDLEDLDDDDDLEDDIDVKVEKDDKD